MIRITNIIFEKHLVSIAYNGFGLGEVVEPEDK